MRPEGIVVVQVRVAALYARVLWRPLTCVACSSSVNVRGGRGMAAAYAGIDDQ